MWLNRKQVDFPSKENHKLYGKIIKFFPNIFLINLLHEIGISLDHLWFCVMDQYIM